MKKENYMSWETYFMSIGILSSFRSKDKKTQNGAVIVNKDNKIVGVGYNGLPIGLNDENPVFWYDEDDNDKFKSKHSYVIHAEQNAIHNKNILSINGSTMYATLFPCSECAKAITQSGIKKVIYLNIKEHHEDENNAVKLMFESANVELLSYNNLNLFDTVFIENLIKMNEFYD